MHRIVDDELTQLKKQLMEMGGHVEKAVDAAIQALTQRQIDKFDEVFEVEKIINREHLQVDEKCLEILAKQSPLATDLRLVIACIKINTDLERMGDQAVNIAHNGRYYLSEPELKPLIDIPRMAQEARLMIQEALQAFVKRDLELARTVLDRDDGVDELKNRIMRDLVAIMQNDSKTVERSLALILIARNLERLGDHATNIAEDVIFAVTGDDIRHGKST